VPFATHITSRQHPLVSEFRRAASRSDDQAPVLLDGEHLLREALDAGLPVDAVLGDGRYPELLQRAERAGARVHTCSQSVLDAASPVRSPSGVVALAAWGPSDLSAVFASQPALVVGLVDVQDPGNVGSAIRSAHALGATGLVAVGATADPAGWKALRGSMGSVFRVPIARGDLAQTLAAARRAGARVLATTSAGGRPLPHVDLASAALVLFGHEGLGLPAAAAAQADETISIPMQPGVDSLNIAVAAALVLDEARRQRGTHTESPR
jgi:TrmH family RNA methyltransferase